MATAVTPKRGEVWAVNFDPAVGAEIGKARPAVVIGVESIGRLPLQLVVPITDWKPAMPLILGSLSCRRTRPMVFPNHPVPMRFK